MSQDDPKNTGTPEDSPSENASRRRFLKGGAMAAVGAIAAAVVAKAAEADVFEADSTTRVAPVPYHPNDTLANVIVNAWANNSYRDTLLKDPKGTLAQAGLSFDDVKVLTEDQYRAGYIRNKKQVIFVLPDKPFGLYVALDQARVAMSVTAFGM